MSKVFIKDLGFKQSASDHSVFYQKTADGHTIIAVATDDMAITSKHTTNIIKSKSEIKKHWEITDNRPITWFLGFQIICNQKSKTISINQQSYIEQMIENFNLTNTKPVSTPIEVGAHFSVENFPFNVKPTIEDEGNILQQSYW